MAEAARADTFNGNVLVASHGRITFQKSVGYADAARSTKLDSRFLFNIGSITKEFSSAALLQLEQRGRLELVDTVGKYLPDLGAWAQRVSIAATLNYTSGIPDVVWKNIRADSDIPAGIRAVTELNFAPGKSYEYNNNNIFLRQMIVERVSGVPYGQYVAQNLFKRCGMGDAAITPVNATPRVAQGFKIGYIADKPDLPITGGAYLTAADMFKWSQCLNRGRLLRRSSIVSLGASFAKDAQSSLGEATYDNGRMIRHVHDGRSGSYEALLVYDASKDITIILLANSYRGKLYEIADSIEQAMGNPGG